jgi:hypothetical protein
MILFGQIQVRCKLFKDRFSHNLIDLFPVWITFLGLTDSSLEFNLLIILSKSNRLLRDMVVYVFYSKFITFFTLINQCKGRSDFAIEFIDVTWAVPVH